MRRCSQRKISLAPGEIAKSVAALRVQSDSRESHPQKPKSTARNAMVFEPFARRRKGELKIRQSVLLRHPFDRTAQVRLVVTSF
jgi:hypothetical protein